MLTPSGVTLSQYINAVKQDATAHVRITFLGQNIVLEDADVHSNGIVIQDCLNGDVDLCFGKAVSRTISIPILNSSKLNGIIWSSEIKVEFGIEISGSTEWVTYGYFTGTRPDKIYNVDVIEYSAYDRMQKFDVLADDWMESLTYPKTVWQMFTSLCDYVGVEYVAGNELANIKARSFASSPFAQVTGVSCRTILATIAEACGCYARINSANKCQMVWFTDHTSDYTLVGNDEFNVSMMDDVPAKTHADLEAYTHADLEHFTHADLMGTKAQFRVYAVNVKQTEDDIGVVYPSETNGNVYYIIDNPFLVTANSTEVNNYIKPIYDRLAAFGGYLPMAVSAIGNALIETGDIITVTVGSATHAMPIFVKNTGFNGAILDMYECTGQFNRTTISPENRMKLSQGGQYHKWKNTVDQLYSELYDPTTGDVSILKQTAQELGLSADGIDIQAGKYINITSGGSFNVDSTNFKINSSTKKITIGTAVMSTAGITFENSDGSTVAFWRPNVAIKKTNVAGIHISEILNQGGTGIAQYTTELMVRKGNPDPATLDYATQDLGFACFEYVLNSENTYTNGAFAFYPNPMTTGSKMMLGRRFHSWDKPWDIAYIDYLKPYHIEMQGIAENSFSPYIDMDGGGSDHLRLEVNSSKYGLYKTNNGTDKWMIYWDVNSDTVIVNAGTVYYGSLIQNSSRDIKHDIQNLTSVGEKLDGLNPVTFIYDNDEEENTRMGLIYEDTIEVMPEICTQDESNKAINYVELIPALLKEIQDLRKRVKELEERE